MQEGENAEAVPGKLDGYELVRIVRERWPAVKIVMTSGFPGTGRDPHAAAFPDIPLLTKPYRRSELAQTISRVLTGPSG
ncbi:MAG TPA: hypothetical protein VKX28_09755 [Xanthobacteraceae bacterium]|nr:hypothetical protein [Xanthobacteraceae bacterium]